MSASDIGPSLKFEDVSENEEVKRPNKAQFQKKRSHPGQCF